MKKLLSILMLLVAIVTGAWADESVVSSAVTWTVQTVNKKGTVTSSLHPSSPTSSSPCDGLYWESLNDNGYIKIANGGSTKAHFNIPAKTSGTLTVSFASSSTSAAKFVVKLGDTEVYSKDTSSKDTQSSGDIIINNTSEATASINFSALTKDHYIYSIAWVPGGLSSCDITFENADGATGIAPAKLTDQIEGTVITLPKNFTMYKDGETFKGWDADDDGDVDYAGGDEYTVSGDATLKAVFEPNGGTTLDSRTGATAITFDFQRKNGAPSVTWQAPTLPTSGVWIAQANVAGKTIDVKMDWDVTTSGAKINNSGWDDWSQLNNGTKFVIPSAAGATVDIEAFNANDNTTTVNGAVRTSVSGNTSHYVINSDAETATIVMSGGGSYYRTIKVTLPGPTYDVDFNLSNVTKTSGEATVEGGTEYIATFAADKGYGFPASVTVTAGGSDISANCTWSSGTLTIPAAYTTDDIAITVNGVAIAGSEIYRVVLKNTTATGTIGGTAQYNNLIQNRDADKGGCKMGNDGAYIGITLATGYKFKAGDIVKVNIGTAGGGTFAFYKESAGTNAILTTTEGSTAGLHTFVLPATADNETSLYLVRKEGSKFNPYVDYISVTRGTEEISTSTGNTYATHVTTADLDFSSVSDKITAYIATGDNGTTIATQAVTEVPAGTPLLIKTASAGATVNVPIATTTPAALTTNKLRSSASPLVITSDDAEAKRYYGFFKVGEKYGFAPMAAGTLAAKKAYLEYESNTLQFIALDLEDAPTAINFVEAENNANSAAPIKVIKNGKLYIGNYNVAGQQVK